MRKFCRSSASAMSLTVTEPNNCSCSPAFCAIVTVTPAIMFARSWAAAFSFASRRRCASRSCSTIFLFAPVAATASFLGSRKLRA